LGGADTGIREDQDMPEEHRAVLAPQVEMAKPQLGVDVQQQLGDLVAEFARYAHVEAYRDVQRLQVFPPCEAKMVVTPTACDRQIDLVARRTLKRPAIVLDRLLEKI